MYVSIYVFFVCVRAGYDAGMFMSPPPSASRAGTLPSVVPDDSDDTAAVLASIATSPPRPSKMPRL